MPDCTPACSQAMSDSQLFNQKLLQDVSALGLYSTILNGVVIAQQAMIDNQVNARQRMTNAASLDYAAALNNNTTDQTGATQNQFPNVPIAQGAAASQVQQPAGAVYPPIRNVDQGSAQVNTGIQAALQAMANSMAELQSSITVLLTRAAGTGAAAAGNPQPGAAA